MSTTLATPSNTQVKVRYTEQYVSEGLNKKLTGAIPAGILRGGRLVAHPSVNMTVTVQSDPDSGDSVFSFVDANGHQLSFRQVGDINLDLTALASSTVYVGLEIIYVVSAATEVYWRAYSAAEVAADPTLVILGEVIVPASGLIPANDVRGRYRDDAGFDLSSGMRDWQQVVENPSFEFSETVTITGAVSRRIPNWEMDPSIGSIAINTAAARTGDVGCAFIGAGGGSHVMAARQVKRPSVLPGQTIKVSARVSWSGVTLGSGAGGSVGLWVSAYERDGTSITPAGDFSFFNTWIADSLDGTVVTGTDTTWHELSGTAKIPPGTGFIRLIVAVTDGTSFVGSIYVDDIKMWVEPGPVKDSYDLRDTQVGPEVYSPGLVVTPQIGDPSVANLNDLLSRAIKMFWGVTSTSPPPEIHMEPVRPSALIPNWLLNLRKGSLKLGEDLIGAASDARKPRILTPITPGGTSGFTLLWEGEVSGGGDYKLRLYATDIIRQSMVITLNAEWNGSAWARDNGSAAFDAWRLDFGSTGLKLYKYISSNNATWFDSAWDDNVDGREMISFSHFLVNTLQGYHEIGNGWLVIEDTDGWSNPAAGSAIQGANTVQAKNIVKAWGIVQTGAGANVLAGFNCSASITGSNILISFVNNMANTNYAVVFGDSTSSINIYKSVNEALGSFEIQGYEGNPVGGHPVGVRNLGVDVCFPMFVVLAQQNT